MLTGDYLARRLIRLKPSEAWNNAGSGLVFVLTRSGSGRYVSNCRKLSHDLKPGDVAVLNPRVIGQISATGADPLTFYCFTAPVEHLMSLFTASEVCMLQGLMSLFDTARHYPASTSLAGECHKLIELAPKDLSFRHRCHLLEVVSAIFSAEMNQVRMDHTGHGGADKHFSEVLGGLTAEDIMSVPVQDLAARFGWSRRHLSRIFLQHFGTSLAELKMELRLLKAADLLLSPNLKVINVADQCGFNHLGLFNTCFKRRLGTSPGQWRKLSPETRAEAIGHTHGDGQSMPPAKTIRVIASRPSSRVDGQDTPIPVIPAELLVRFRKSSPANSTV